MDGEQILGLVFIIGLIIYWWREHKNRLIFLLAWFGVLMLVGVIVAMLE